MASYKPIPSLSESDLVRFQSNFIRGNPDECWEWRGAPTQFGYGSFSICGRGYPAHRVSYAVAKGTVDPTLTLDHLCRNRCCVNPNHLEPVTNRENLLRGYGPSGLNARKDYCDHGHELTPANIYEQPSRPGYRLCRLCRQTHRKTQKPRIVSHYQKRTAAGLCRRCTNPAELGKRLCTEHLARVAESTRKWWRNRGSR